MNYEITKLDRRHAWYGQFAYMIEFKKTRQSFYNRSNQGVLEFDRSRRWFNEKFGWSQDVETRSQIGQVRAQLKEDYTKDVNLYWAYSIKYDEYRIYVQSDRELNWFTLSHPKSHDD
jgi:glucose/arabinose dehydrogenase